MKQHLLTTSLKTIVTSVLLASLVACGSSDDRKESATSKHEHNHDHGDDHKVEESDKLEVKHGRLFIAEKNTNKVHVYSIAQKKVIQTVTLGNEAQVDALYTSPKGGYAVVIDRKNNKVNFYNSGLTVEEHGDHDHPYAKEVTKTNLQLNYVRPVHFQSFEDQATMFFDGKGKTGNPINNPDAKAGFVLITDELIGKGTLPHVELNTNMHGTAEPRPNHVLAVSRNVQTKSSLPETVDVYHYENKKLNKEKTLATKCPGLHGSASSEDYSVFACSDGVLSVKQDGETFTDTKIVNNETIKKTTCKGHGGGVRPARLGSVKANGKNNFVGTACSQPFEFDVKNNKINDINWTTDKTLKVASYQFDAHGEHLLILDNKGTLHILHVEDNYEVEKSIKVLKEVKATGHSAPKLLVNPNNDLVYLVDGHDKKVIAVDVEKGKVTSTTSLDFEASKYTWFGVKNGHEAHEHKH